MLGRFLSRKPKAPQSAIRAIKLNNKAGNSELALLSFDGMVRDQLVEELRSNYLATGVHVRNGGTVSRDTILPVIGGGAAALGASYAMSGQLFMATANPATLMTIGQGVGSAVMGAGGIVAQAPFIPVAGALMPVLAPLIAFQALTSISMVNKFEAINKRLDKVEEGINRIIQRSEATYIGEVISAQARLHNIEDRLKEAGRFTNHMVIRLSLVEDSINPLFERYRYLLDSQRVESNMSSDDLAYRHFDAFMAITTSIIDMKVDVLRLKLTHQENPAYIAKSTENLINKVKQYRELWSSINESLAEIEQLHEDVSAAIEDMNWWQKNISRRKKRKQLKEQQSTLTPNERQAESIGSTIDNAMKVGDVVQTRLNQDQDEQLAIVYWKDDHGEHCYYTADLFVAAEGIPRVVES